jgi:hypothetical protein
MCWHLFKEVPMAVESIGAGASNKAKAQANINDGDETPGAAGTVDKLA